MATYLQRRVSRRGLGAGGRLPRPGEADQHGFTIVELSVAMLILGVLMAMVMAGMTHLINPTIQTEAIRDTSDQLNLAFLELDSNVRYATDIWQPYAGSPSTNDTWDIEFESTYGSSPTCTELQYNYSSGQLLRANWTKGATTAPGFKMIANDLTGSADPFSVLSNSEYEKVQLMVTLTAVSGSGQGRETTSSSVTYTALDSTSDQAASSADTDCTASWTTA